MEKPKKYQLPAEGKMVDVTEEQYRAFYKCKRREKYLEGRDQKHKLYHYSDLDTEELLGEEMFSYPNEESIEERIIDRLLIESLLRCVGKLPEEDRKLIYALYYQGKSERACADEFGISQKTINNQRNRILDKLRDLMNNL